MKKHEYEIINKVKNYVKNNCENESSGHDFTHIERVYNNAMNINKEEQQNEFIITMIALLHDMYDHKFYKGDSSKKLIELLKELNIYKKINKKYLENIICSCVNLGYSQNLINKKELSNEGKIVQDADRLDAMGAIGIARTFMYSGKFNIKMYNKNLEFEIENNYKEKGSSSAVNHFYDKLLNLKDLMNTKTAKKIAIKRHRFLINYLDELIKEINGFN